MKKALIFLDFQQNVGRLAKKRMFHLKLLQRVIPKVSAWLSNRTLHVCKTGLNSSGLITSILFVVFSSTGGGLGALLGGIFMQGEIDIEILQKWSNDFYPGKIFIHFFDVSWKKLQSLLYLVIIKKIYT
jgi:hypothetical protein